MAQIHIPQKKQDSIGKYLQLGGTIAGGVIGSIGGPGPGTVAGASAGGAIGGALGGAADMATPQKPPVEGVPGQSGQARAMADRLQRQTQDNLAVLSKAESQLPKLPESLRQQYAPAIIQARMLEQRNRGLA